MMTLIDLISSKPAQSFLKQLCPLKYIDSAFIKQVSLSSILPVTAAVMRAERYWHDVLAVVDH